MAYVSEEQKGELNEEHEDFRWVSLAEAAELVPFGGQRHYVCENPTRILRPPALQLAGDATSVLIRKAHPASGLYFLLSDAHKATAARVHLHTDDFPQPICL